MIWKNYKLKKVKNNREDHLEMKKLLDRWDLVIRPADKGGGIVLMAKTKHIMLIRCKICQMTVPPIHPSVKIQQ